MPTAFSNLETIIVDAEGDMCRVDKYVIDRFSLMTRTSVQYHIKEGDILVNEKKIKPSYKVKAGDRITYRASARKEAIQMVAEDIALDIVYEDDQVVVVNKPAEMVVHPACDNWRGTLMNGLLYRYKDLPFVPGNACRPGLVHRIDKGTSGLLVVAKTPKSLLSLSEQFKRHTILREYLALAWGVVEKDQETLSLRLTRSPKDRRIMQVCSSSSLVGKHAVTHYKVVKRWPYATLVTCTLETGRTHQIRAHMKHLGHPLFGDPRYGGDQVVYGPCFAKYKSFVHNCLRILPYQALHAQKLGFVHPTTQREIAFHLPPPEPLQKVLDKWERYNLTV